MNKTWVLGVFYAVFVLVLISVLYVYKTRRVYTHQRRLSQTNETHTIGFFHPYANGGGGGERVLYCAILALVRESQRTHTKLRILLYTGDDQLTVSALITRAAERFNLPELQSLHVDTFIRLVLLPNRNLLEPSQYPRFTLFWQSIAHIRLAITGFRASERLGLYPQVWIDTTGCPFAYVIAHVLYTCSVVAYVHYPMISTDMIEKVVSRQSDYNNPSHIASSLVRSYIKLMYYKLFAWIYGYVGRTCTDVVMVNSTWTYHHITRLWGRTTLPITVYPPCGNIKQFSTFSITSRQPIILSISQFRPEKNQLLQLQAFAQFLQTSRQKTTLKLALVGSCRNKEDEERVKLLREQCAELKLLDHVEFIVNAPFSKLQELLATASMGIHTMYNEHFGISIVEMMAAGLIVIANNSGGPAADIIETKESHRNGFLALTAQEYAEAMVQVLNMSASETLALRKRAQTASFRYSDETFEQQWRSMMQPALQ